MNKILDQLRETTRPRDPNPLQSLFFSWAEKRGKKDRLPFSQERLLESINEAPCLNTTERTSSLGWSSNRFANAREKLEASGLIETKQIASGTGRPHTHLILTDNGFSHLRKLRVTEKRLHGSLEHHCAILKLKKHFESHGYKTEITKKLTPKYIVDLFCEKGDVREAVEVVASNNVHRDAEKCASLAKKISCVHLVTTTNDLFDHYVAKLGKLLDESIRETVQVSMVDELIRSGS